MSIAVVQREDEEAGAAGEGGAAIGGMGAEEGEGHAEERGEVDGRLRALRGEEDSGTKEPTRGLAERGHDCRGVKEPGNMLHKGTTKQRGMSI